MIFRRFRRSPQTASIAALYGMIVAQARAPAFYRDYGVPDTVEGRLEMLILHIVLVLRHLEALEASQPARTLGQQLFDHFCRDMDASMREMGVGDLTVPRRMRQIGEAFYGRQAAYRASLAAEGPRALAGVLDRNVFGHASAADGSIRLAAYVREAVRCLDRGGPDCGQWRFPDPDRIAAWA
jgi:cytochrome b pre-mRNA-processing protein 3